jgi:hypothetical protein
MTELQRIFLVYTGMYFVVIAALYLAFHVALIILEREARIKHAKCKVLVARKRVMNRKDGKQPMHSIIKSTKKKSRRDWKQPYNPHTHNNKAGFSKRIRLFAVCMIVEVAYI